RGAGTDVETDRCVDTSELVVGDAGLTQTFGPLGVGLARAHRAEVADARRERSDDGGNIELAVVREHAHRVAWPELVADLLQVAVGPLVDDLVGHGKPLPRSEHRARVADHDAIA